MQPDDQEPAVSVPVSLLKEALRHIGYRATAFRSAGWGGAAAKAFDTYDRLDAYIQQAEEKHDAD